MTSMRYALGIILVIHGVAHLVGFVVPWRLADLKDAPYRTTVLNGRLDVGHAGIRVVGVLWLLAAVGFAISGVALITLATWWLPLTVAVTIWSLVLAVLQWPESRIGVAIDVVLLAYLLIGRELDWISALGV